MASSDGKKRRIDGEPDSDVSDYPKYLIKLLVNVLHKIVVCGVPELTPLKILNCNAADGKSGISFSKAYCCVADESNKRFAFADLFERGISILISFVEKQEMPNNRQEKFVLQKLLDFLSKKVGDFPGENLESLEETELSIFLANHLFGEVARTSRYIIDKHYAGEKRSDRCPCEKSDCTLSGNLGDTSIGHGEVWHGEVDVILNNHELVVDAVVDDESETKQKDSPGGKSPVKVKSADLLRNPKIIAETIVFSFLQKQWHPVNENFLVPCIGVGHSDIVVMFYDSEYDVLLESSPIPLLQAPISQHEVFPAKISDVLVVISWLVANYEYLSSGLPDIAQKYKADFCTIPTNKLEVYETKLQFGNVEKPFVQRKRDFEINRPRVANIREKIRKVLDLQFNLYNPS